MPDQPDRPAALPACTLLFEHMADAVYLLDNEFKLTQVWFRQGVGARAEEWRVHFHIPLHAEPGGDFGDVHGGFPGGRLVY